ncbi:MAG TPA: SRPBCC family protein [Alphaproteobacteria bacterium]
MDDHGVVTAPGTLRLERLLPGPIERVWAYLTESDKRSRWLAAGPMKLRPGGKVELTWHNSRLSSPPEEVPEKYRKYEGHSMRGEILRCEPPRLLSFTWGETEVMFELAEKGQDVVLTLTHRRITDRGMLLGVSGGWHLHLDILVERLNGQVPKPFWAQHEAIETAYAKRLADAPLAEPAAG